MPAAGEIKIAGNHAVVFGEKLLRPANHFERFHLHPIHNHVLGLSDNSFGIIVLPISHSKRSCSTTTPWVKWPFEVPMMRRIAVTVSRKTLVQQRELTGNMP